MKIPLPCKFGESAICKNKELPLEGVSWFKWTQGMEYTYFFTKNDKWHEVDFYNTFQNDQPEYIEIPNNLLDDAFIKDRGYPLKGRGYANGIYYKNGKTYIDFIMTDRYFAHIKVQCDSEGKYIPNGDIICPTAWDTEEKQERAILKSIKFIQGEPLKIKEPQPKQLSIFDFITN